MAVASEFVVRINVKEQTLDVAGPDKDWVDAKIEQFSRLVSDAVESRPQVPATGVVPSSPSRRARARARTARAADQASPTPRRPRGAGGRSAINEDLKGRFTADVRGEFKAYITDRSRAWADSQPAQAAIIATFLQDSLSMSGVDQHDLYTVYTVMGERSPGNIRSQLTNARQRSRYFSGLSDGKMVLSHAGENYARFDSLDSAAADR